MDKLLIIDKFLRCRFSLKVGSIRLEPDLFCQLEKNLTSSVPVGYNEACTNLVAKPYPFEVVAANLKDGVEKGKLPEEATQITQDEIARIQAFIASHYNFTGNCYNCHY